MSLVQKIRSRINSGTRSEYDEDALIDVHHILMREYGWIPMEELFGMNHVSYIEYSIPIIIPKPWYKPWLWKLSEIKFKATKTRKKQGLPLPTMWNLIDCIRKEKEQESKSMKNIRKK